MMNKKLIALFVAIATVVSISAYHRDYDDNCYRDKYGVKRCDYDRNYDHDYDYHDRRYHPVGHTAKKVFEGTEGVAERAVRAPGDILFGDRN